MKHLLLALLLCSCSEDDRTFATEQSAALCGLYHAACVRQAECGVYLYNRTTDVERCEAQLGCEQVAEGFAAAGVEISIRETTACRAAVEAATCEGLVRWDGEISSALVNVEPACVAMFQGTREQGETCGWSQQCKPGLACGGDTCPGTCEEEVVACTVGSCAASEYCTSSGRCEPRAATGEACGSSDFENACGDGLFCDGTTCRPAIPHGGACSLISFFTCADGDVCRDNVCAAPTPTGAACSVGDECGYGSFCAFAEGSVCKPWLALGAACHSAIFECGPNATCEAGACAAVKPDQPVVPTETHALVGLGERCELAPCSAGLACRPLDDAWTCQRAPGLGESCRPADPADELAVVFSGTAGIGGCAEGICDVLASWTCIVPAMPGAACETPGVSAECASSICKADHTCAAFFEECP